MGDRSKIKEINEIINTLSGEAQNNALSKCKEKEYKTDQGPAPLEESFTNLNAACALLKDAIEQNKLINLPITVQNKLHLHLGKIASFLKELGEGVDQVLNITNEIEELNIVIWQYGFHNLSASALGYLEKTNQIKKLEKELYDLSDKLKTGLNLKDNVENLVDTIKKEIDAIEKKKSSIDDNLVKSTTNVTEITDALGKATKNLSEITEQEKDASNLVEVISDFEEKSKEQYKNIEKLSKLSDQINLKISEQQVLLDEIIVKGEEANEKILERLPGATSVGLASTFNERKLAIEKNKKLLLISFSVNILLMILSIIFLPKYLEIASNGTWWEFILHRVPLASPFIWLGWVLVRNYGHATMLEEDYAYKESISMSFEGYKKQMQEIDDVALKELCARTITILSDSPLRVFSRKTNDETPLHSILEKIVPKEADKKDKSEQVK